MNNRKSNSPDKDQVYISVLKESQLFEDLAEIDLHTIYNYLEPLVIKKGEDVFNKHITGRDIFILVSGEINAWTSRFDGTLRMVPKISPGAFLGGLSLIASDSGYTTFTAAMDSEFLILKDIDFYRIMFDHPRVACKMLNAIKKAENVWLEQASAYLNDILRWGEVARRRTLIDELTGLYNRRFLEENGKGRFAATTIEIRIFSILLIDVGGLRSVNEKHGLGAKDKVFVSTADVLRNCTRAGDICAKLAGDEFAVLLPDTGVQEACIIAERIQKAMDSRLIAVPKSPNSDETVRIKADANIGIAAAPLHADSWKNLLSAADNALLSTKKPGKSRIEIAHCYS